MSGEEGRDVPDKRSLPNHARREVESLVWPEYGSVLQLGGQLRGQIKLIVYQHITNPL